MDPSNWTFASFVRDLIPNCQDPHWMPQSQRMEAKYWSLISFVGRIESASTDAHDLLDRLGAYQEFGINFTAKEQHTFAIFTANTAHHATYSSDRLRSYYTPELEQLVENYYSEDYSHPVLNLTLLKIDFGGTANVSAFSKMSRHAIIKKPG